MFGTWVWWQGKRSIWSDFYSQGLATNIQAMLVRIGLEIISFPDKQTKKSMQTSNWSNDNAYINSRSGVLVHKEKTIQRNAYPFKITFLPKTLMFYCREKRTQFTSKILLHSFSSFTEYEYRIQMQIIIHVFQYPMIYIHYFIVFVIISL